MPEKNNAAGRVYELLCKAKEHDTSGPTGSVWAEVFGVPFKKSPAGYGPVLRPLSLLAEELESAYQQMEASPHSPDTYRPAFTKIRTAIGVRALHQNWNTHRQHLDDSTLRMIKICSELLPAEDRIIPDDVVSRLTEILDDLAELAEDEDCPPTLRTFLHSQIGIIEQVLRDFPIIGDRAFDRAVMEVLISYPEYRPLLDEHSDSEAVGLLRSAWTLLGTWSNRVAALQAMLQQGESITHLIGPS